MKSIPIDCHGLSGIRRPCNSPWGCIVLALFIWHFAHEAQNDFMSAAIFGHQYDLQTETYFRIWIWLHSSIASLLTSPIILSTCWTSYPVCIYFQIFSQYHTDKIIPSHTPFFKTTNVFYIWKTAKIWVWIASPWSPGSNQPFWWLMVVTGTAIPIDSQSLVCMPDYGRL